MIKTLSLLLLAALPLPGFGITLGDFDPLRDLGLKTHIADRDADAYGETENINVERLVEKDADSTKYLPPLTTSPPTEVLTLVEPNRFREKRGFDVWSCKKHAPCNTCLDAFKRCTDGVTSSVPTRESSTVESSPSTTSDLSSTSSDFSSTSSGLSSTTSDLSSTSSDFSSTLSDFSSTSSGLSSTSSDLSSAMSVPSTISTPLSTIGSISSTLETVPSPVESPSLVSPNTSL
ncbi:hypothetical protein GQX73_g7067 [Xylaria multiplex]|uniref:Uncharacterized protein n=1 Tax=Xylaria multiplex TaxID=323545 RepID=A0A7C8IU48_9PEZI|nr:hypothetical protein GQX73_g7067 [Xylaria multiplex]